VATIARSRPVSIHGVHWEYLVPIASVHLLACLAVTPWCFSWSGLALAAIGTNVFGTLGINLCYHRLLSHRSLERRPWVGVAIYLAHAAVFAMAGLLVGRWVGGDWSHGRQLAASWIVWGVFVRTVLVWHITWSVNSLTHLFGYRSYVTDEDSRNNWFVALVAMGEGWHNNHHHDPASASVQHRWWEFDVTYYLILLLERLGLATDVIQPRHVRQRGGAGS